MADYSPTATDGFRPLKQLFCPAIDIQQDMIPGHSNSCVSPRLGVAHFQYHLKWVFFPQKKHTGDLKAAKPHVTWNEFIRVQTALSGEDPLYIIAMCSYTTVVRTLLHKIHFTTTCCLSICNLQTGCRQRDIKTPLRIL